MPQNDNNKNGAAEEIFLPNFCGWRVMFVVVIIAELCAIVLSLAPMNLALDGRWLSLGLISMFAQWTALSCSGVLCLSRPYLNRFNNR